MNCPKCGSDVPEGASFCINCGATVGGGDEKAPAETAAPPEEKTEPEPPKPEPVTTEPKSDRPAELAASEVPDELPEPDRKLDEKPAGAEKTPEPQKPPKTEKPREKTAKPYRDYRKPITAVIFVIVIVCSIFACCAFCVIMSYTQGYAPQ